METDRGEITEADREGVDREPQPEVSDPGSARVDGERERQPARVRLVGKLLVAAIESVVPTREAIAPEVSANAVNVTGGIVTQLVGRDVHRRSMELRNAGPDPVRIGGQWLQAFTLASGDRLEVATTAGLWVLADVGDTAEVEIVVTTDRRRSP